MTIPRYLQGPIGADLEQKMVFLAGPGQVGKTTLAQALLAKAPGAVYLNWDNAGDRREIRAARWPGGQSLVVLDELHKWRGWKRWLKGEFDKHRELIQFLVTGRARLDVYRRGSDSLQGRYHHYRLHPLSVAELQRGGVGASNGSTGSSAKTSGISRRCANSLLSRSSWIFSPSGWGHRSPSTPCARISKRAIVL